MTAANLPLKVDLRGRVRNMRLAPSNAMLALCEAVVNSIHAILDSTEPDKGQITITILRGTGQLALNGKAEPGPVTSFYSDPTDAVFKALGVV